MVPWALQLLFFTLLYATFPQDRDASIELERQRRLAMVSGPTSNLLQASGAALTCHHCNFKPGSFVVCRGAEKPCMRRPGAVQYTRRLLSGAWALSPIWERGAHKEGP